MRKVQRWSYYCDFCKKSLGTGASLGPHYSGYTTHPDRHCRFCDLLNGGQGTPLAKLRRFVAGHAHYHTIGEDGPECGTLSKEHTATLREMTDGCPVCMFAAIRQTSCFIADFDLKAEVKSLWDVINASKWDGVAQVVTP